MSNNQIVKFYINKRQYIKKKRQKKDLMRIKRARSYCQDTFLDNYKKKSKKYIYK